MGLTPLGQRCAYEEISEKGFWQKNLWRKNLWRKVISVQTHDLRRRARVQQLAAQAIADVKQLLTLVAQRAHVADGLRTTMIRTC